MVAFFFLTLQCFCFFYLVRTDSFSNWMSLIPAATKSHQCRPPAFHTRWSPVRVPRCFYRAFDVHSSTINVNLFLFFTNTCKCSICVHVSIRFNFVGNQPNVHISFVCKFRRIYRLGTLSEKEKGADAQGRARKLKLVN